MSQRDERIAYVSELPDGEDVGRMTGLFGAHWESEDGERWGEGPRRVAQEVALEWARRHATRVLVLLPDDDSLYSAGEEQLDDLPSWPDGGIPVRPRPDGSPRDGSEQEVAWSVRAETTHAEGTTKEEIDRLRALLKEHERVGDVRVSLVGGRLLVDCAFTARSMSAATIEVDRLVEAAARQALPELGDGVRAVSTQTLGRATQ